MIRGEKVTLRGVEPADTEVLGCLRNDVASQLALMTRPRPNGSARVSRWLDRVSEDPTMLFFVVADAATDRAVGFVQLADIDLVSRHGRLGICLERQAWGQGYGSQGISLLLGHAARVLNLRKVVLEVLASNTRAIRAYERNEFREAGRLASHFYVDGEFHDVIIMERMIGP